MSFTLYPSNQAYQCVWKRITETPASLATGQDAVASPFLDKRGR